MPLSRRSFLQTVSAAATAMAAGPTATGQSTRAAKPASRKLDLLILGGTGFLGPAIVESAMARGHTMTIFNRGTTRPDIFPGIERLRGDRDPLKDDGLAALKDRSWDAVIDTSGYYPRMVRASAQMLADVVRQYVFISSISVYSDNSIVDMDESGPIATMDDPTLESMGNEFQYYGALMALCVQAADVATGGRATNIRPGLIVGPRDNVPRFTYWPVRVERGGEVLSPGRPRRAKSNSRRARSFSKRAR